MPGKVNRRLKIGKGRVCVNLKPSVTQIHPSWMEALRSSSNIQQGEKEGLYSASCRVLLCQISSIHHLYDFSWTLAILRDLSGSASPAFGSQLCATVPGLLKYRFWELEKDGMKVSRFECLAYVPLSLGGRSRETSVGWKSQSARCLPCTHYPKKASASHPAKRPAHFSDGHPDSAMLCGETPFLQRL